MGGPAPSVDHAHVGLCAASTKSSTSWWDKLLLGRCEWALGSPCPIAVSRRRSPTVNETAREAAGAAWHHSGHASATPQCGQTTWPTSPRTFTTPLRESGLRRICFHDLRHSAATSLEQGVELVVIKELLGHAHVGVTAGVYAHVRLRLQRQATETLGDALGLTGDDPNGVVR